jgi:hypothetical protein
MTLVINRYDNFELVANDAHGSASFTTNAAGTKIYTSQSAQGGDRSVSGFLLPEQGGARELSMIAASSIYGNVADFAGRVAGDSAIITDRVHCDRAVGGDSVHVFTVILK